MATLDSSILVVGLPTVVEDLNTSLFLGIWVITGYRLVLTIFLVAIGRMIDIAGRVKLYNTGFGLFTVGSALCALSPTVELLIAFRLIQGLGGALLFANSLAIVTDSFPISELGIAVGINQMALNGGTIVGFSLSGVMIELFGWRSIFWINVPIGLFGTYWCHKGLKDLYVSGKGQKLDHVGAVTFSTCLTLLLVALTGDFRDQFIQLLFGLSIVLFAFFLAFERRIDQPVLDLNLFKIRAFAAGNISSLLNGLAFSGLAFVLTLYFQVVRGLGPFQAGIALLPLELAFIFVCPISGRLSDIYGARVLSSIGLIMMSMALVMFANFTSDSNFIFVAVSLTLVGVGAGLFRPPNTSSIMGSVPPDRRGIANGVRSTIWQSTLAISIPLAMTLMTAVLPYNKIADIILASTLHKEEVLEILPPMSFAFYGLALINALGVIASIFREPRKRMTVVE